MASRRVLVLLAVAGSLCAAAVGQGVFPFNPSCSTTDNYTDGSQYKKNLDELLASLPAAAGSNSWFYSGTAGVPGTPDQVFGLIMCYADRNAAQCKACLDGAPAGITRGQCRGSRNVRAAYDAWVLRYSPAPPFAGTADTEAPFVVFASAPVPVDSAAMAKAWLPLMTDLTGRAAGSPLRAANGSTPYDGDATNPVYGLAQCTRDLNGSECTRCPSSLVGHLSTHFTNQTGGAIKACSCYVKYQLGAFDITLPPELPQLPPPPSPQPGDQFPILFADME